MNQAPRNRSKDKTPVRLPDLAGRRPNHESSAEKEREQLTDPPQLKKGPHKPISQTTTYKQMELTQKMAELVERTQQEFGELGRQMLAMQERQESFNMYVLDHLQKSSKTSRTFEVREGAGGLREGGQELEVRDRFLLVDFPAYKEKPYSMGELKRWLSRVFTKTFSIAFHHYSRGAMTFEQTKIYCSMNVLHNLIKLSQINPLTASQLEEMDEYLASHLLKYLDKKYPLTEGQSSHKKLEGVVHEINNLGTLSNNYLGHSSVEFERRDSGNYNGQIMRLLNEILSSVDSKPQDAPRKGKATNYTEFEKVMGSIFAVIEEEEPSSSEVVPSDLTFGVPAVIDFVSDKLSRPYRSALREARPDSEATSKDLKDSSKIRVERQRYKSKVREYTSYSIARKVPQFVAGYSPREIESQNMSIKHPSVFRMLTKWCEELKSKFTTANYFATYSDNIRVQRGGAVNSLLFPMRQLLDQEMRLEWEHIQEDLHSLAENNYMMQLELLRREIGPFKQEELEDLELEQISGRYSIEIVNNLHSYLITYLNRLIHGLMNVAERFWVKSNLKDNSNWPTPPNLLTFSIGDLLRCRISSQESEIVRIYEHLKQFSAKHPEKLKIIRVKNRLKQSTNDILINVKFNNLIIGQMQLGVKSQLSNFIACSNKFSHYIYQLERSPFGSIAELCNTWVYLDKRAESYRREVEEEAQKQQIQRVHACQAQMSSFSRPFICYSCNVAYYHNNYLKSHLYCPACKNVICVKCQLRAQDPTKLKDSLISNRSLRKSCQQMMSRIENSVEIMDHELPEYGVCILIESRVPKIEVFRVVSYNGQRFILGRAGGRIYQVDSIQNDKELAAFMRKYVIFNLAKNQEEHCRIKNDEAVEEYILPQVLENVYKREKESVVLGDKLSNKIVKKVLSQETRHSKEKVKKMFLDCNEITHVDFLADHFTQINLLELSSNPIRSLEGVQLLTQLRYLSLDNCHLSQLPTCMFNLSALEELSLGHNELTKLPVQVEKLFNLKILEVSHNQLQALPAEMGGCRDLIVLRCAHNQLIQLPATLSQLNQLASLQLGHNKLRQLPENLNELLCLQELHLNHNMIDSLPSCLTYCYCLLRLDLSHNLLTTVDIPWSNLQCLQALNLSANVQLNSLPDNFRQMRSLHSLWLDQCSLTEVPEAVCGLARLRALFMSKNRVNCIRRDINKLKELQILDFSHNMLSRDSYDQRVFQSLNELKILALHNNQIDEFPNLYFCQKLSQVNLSHNLLKNIQEHDVLGLDALQVLNVSHNQLESIAQCITSINKLRELNVSHNKLTKLGYEMDGGELIWPNLNKINLAANQLLEVPQCLFKSSRIGSLQNMEAIDITQNQVENLPSELKNLKNLKKLNCRRNKIRVMEPELRVFMKERKISLDDTEFKLGEEMSPVKKRTFNSRKRDFRRTPRLNQ